MVKTLKNFLQNQESFCQKGIDNLLKWLGAIEQDGRHADIW